MHLHQQCSSPFTKRSIHSFSKTILLRRAKCRSLMRDPLIRSVRIEPLDNVLTTNIRMNTTYLGVKLSFDLSLQHLEPFEYLRIFLNRVHEHHSRVIVDIRHDVFGPTFRHWLYWSHYIIVNKLERNSCLHTATGGMAKWACSHRVTYAATA